MPRSERQKLAL